MKTANRIKTSIVVAGLITGIAIGSAQAQLVIQYSDNFSGDAEDNLHGTTPDTTTGGATWSAHENWKADGSIADATEGEHNAYLPFSPETGWIYTLTVTLDKPTKEFAAFGFTEGNAGVTSSGSFFGAGNNANPWFFYRSSGEINARAFPATGGSDDIGGYTGTQTLSIVLDTTETLWSVAWFDGVDSDPVHTWDYTENPTINWVGMGRQRGAGANLSSFELSVIPEPSTSALIGVVALGLVAFRRRLNR